MRVHALFAVLIMSSMLDNAYAQEPIVMEQASSNGLIKVQLIWPEIRPDKIYTFDLKFLDPLTNELIKDVNFDVLITQNDHLIESYYDLRSEDGNASVEVMFLDTGSALVEVTILGIGENILPQYVSEKSSFFVDVIPEFPGMLVLIIAASFALVGLFRLKHLQFVA